VNTLSVVIIGRNEESHIAKCIRSVLKDTADFRDCDIIYVDSASSDNTVHIAKQHPIRIIQLRPDWPLSSSAGRYLGFIHTSGEYVFFIDGDTIVYKQWLTRAVAFLSSQMGVGGVAGIVNELFIDSDGRIQGMKKNRYNQKENIEDARVFGGIALYRRKVLEEVNPFNPYVVATPELELSLRIRKAGYRLARIYEPMAITYAPQRETAGEIIRRARANLYSMGNTLHYCRRNGVFWRYVKERMGFVISYAAVLLVSSGIVVFSLVTKNSAMFYAWGTLIILFVLMHTIRKRSIKKVFISLFKRTVILYKTIESYVKTSVKDVDEFPKDVIIIQ